MSDLVQLQKRQNQTLLLVCINFVLFVVLFSALGYVAWQSATLVNRLQEDLGKAEQTIAQLQGRFQNMDLEDVVDRLVNSATAQLGTSIAAVVQQSDLGVPMTQVSAKITAAQEMIEQTGEVVAGIQKTVAGLDNEAIAQQVSYHILKGLGDGFQQAAESRKPGSSSE
ncbi:MAG: hypothetical protein WBW79_03420 [Desulfocapsaceae bacterium]|jgi:predicted PurR-regulated permease PerM